MADCMVSLIDRKKKNYGGFLYWATGQGVYAVSPRNMENFAARCGSSCDKSRCQRVKACLRESFSDHCVCFKMYEDLFKCLLQLRGAHDFVI